MGIEDIHFAIFNNTKYIRNQLDNLYFLKWHYDIEADKFENGSEYLIAIPNVEEKRPIILKLCTWNGMYFEDDADIYSVKDVLGYMSFYDINYAFDYSVMKKGGYHGRNK